MSRIAVWFEGRHWETAESSVLQGNSSRDRWKQKSRILILKLGENFSCVARDSDENHGNSPETIIEIPHPLRAAVGH